MGRFIYDKPKGDFADNLIDLGRHTPEAERSEVFNFTSLVEWFSATIDFESTRFGRIVASIDSAGFLEINSLLEDWNFTRDTGFSLQDFFFCKKLSSGY